MAKETRCSRCGAFLSGNMPHGFCPKCLIKVGFEGEADATLEEPRLIEGPGTKIGHYELLELIGEGGMGLVYLAEQQEPKRKVALKIVKLGMDTKQVVARFEAERQTLALLEHPNIAHVFDAGTTETGRPYFVMEYVEGRSITKYCDEQTLSIEQRLELFQQVCEGVHHAHQKGIIHRDLKPSNILVSVHGDRAVPKIIDFGIAKAVTQPLLTEKTSYTEHGQLMGTPEYMSPEQAEMAYQDVDTRSDIYSLGVLLYELLAGATPFDAKRLRKGGIDHIQQVICGEEPRTPSARLTSLGDKAEAVAERRRTQIITLTRRLHRELEWIPMKAMRKDPTRRYRSASELSDDIQNYLTGAPLIAGPESSVYRARKFVRKHAGFVASTVLVAVVIVIGLITSTAFSISAEKARGEEAIARAQAEEAREEAELARDKEAALRQQVEQALVRAEKAESLAEERNEDYRRALYVKNIQLADAKYRESNVGNARTLLDSCPEDLRGWEWDRVNHVLDQSVRTYDEHKGSVFSVSVSPDGNRLLTGGSDKGFKVWDMTTGKELTALSRGHEAYAYRVNFSPDGKQFVSGYRNGDIRVWDVTDVNTAVTSIKHGSSWVTSVSFSPDSKRIVSTCSGEKAKVWDAVTGAEILALSVHNGGVRFAAFSPNGEEIVSGGRDGTIKVWDSVSGDEVMSLAGHDDWIYAISFNPDGSLFASGSFDKTVKIWNAKTGTLVMTLHGHDGPVTSVAFTQDDQYVISGSWDSTVRIWDTATGRELKILRGHDRIVNSVVLTPDGKQAISGGNDRTVKIWDVTVDREITRFSGHRSQVASIAFSPDGKRLVSHSKNGEVKVWDVASSAELIAFSEGRESLLGELYHSSIAFSPDGSRITSLGAECAMTVWDVKTGAEVTRLGNMEDNVICFAVNPNGNRIVSGSSHGKLTLWDAIQGEEIMTFSEDEPRIYSVAFSPDGHRIASGSYNNIKVWDVESGAELKSIMRDPKKMASVVFSPDGKRIAAADRPPRIWDVATGKELMTLRGHGDTVVSIAFSPDGRRLVTGSQDGTARVWDSLTGDELITLRVGSTVTGGVFSPDGKSIAGGTLGKTILLWESAAPVDGYGPRKTTATAKDSVDELHETHGLYHDVIEKLKVDTTLDEPVRKAALQIANARKGEDAEMLVKEGWEMVSSADKDIDAYRSIVDKAQKVALSEPENASVLKILGVGQYRVGAYAEALDTLKHAEKMRADNNPESNPVPLAFMAMALYQLGQVDEGRFIVRPLRDSFEEIKFEDITSGSLSCWIEAETIFAGTHEQLLAIWELISTNELDRAVAMFADIEPSPEEADSDVAFSLEGMTKFLSRACYARGKSRLAGDYPDYVNRAFDYETAIRVDPNYLSALKDLAWLRATCTVEEVRIPASAVELATQACELTDWENHECISILAAAYSETGDFDAAVKWQKTATALLPDDCPKALRANYATRCSVYQSHQPYHTGSLWSFSDGELVAHWKFEEAKNGEVLDSAGKGLHGRLIGDAQIVSDMERGSVLRLPGKGDFVACGWNSAFDITGAITIAAWTKVTELESRWWIVISNNYCLGLLGYNDDPKYSNRIYPAYWHEGGVWIETELDVDNQWHLIVVLYDGQEFALYIDGKLGASKCFYESIAMDTGPLYIGPTKRARNEGLKDGLIDDVRIYSYALSPDEVKGLYEGREPPRERR
ncbi:protein kinase [Planctomycetota bacterium]